MSCIYEPVTGLNIGCVGYCDEIDLEALYGAKDYVLVTVHDTVGKIRQVTFEYDPPAFVLNGLFSELGGVYLLTFEDEDGNLIVVNQGGTDYDHVMVEVMPVANYDNLCPCDESIF